MSELFTGFRLLLQELIKKKRQQGSIGLQKICDPDTNDPYELRLVPLCPTCGADLMSSGKYLHCIGKDCLYGRELR